MRTRKKGKRPLKIAENWSIISLSAGRGIFIVEIEAVASPVSV